MRYLIVTHIEIPGGMGAERRISMFARALSQRGHFVTITGLKKKETDDCNWDGDRVKMDSVNPALNRPLGKAITYISSRLVVLKSILRNFREEWDAIVFYNIGIDSIPAVLLSKLLRIKVFTENCDLRSFEKESELKDILLTAGYRLSENIISNMADVNITVSALLGRRLKRYSKKKIIFVPAIVDMEKYKYNERGANEFRNKNDIRDRRVVLYMGSFRKIEGVKCLIESFPMILERLGRDVLLLIAGRIVNSPLHDDIDKIIEKSTFKENIKYLGLIEEEDEIIKMLSASEVVVVPKLDNDENRAGFPQKVAEILATGRPLVVTSVGDIPKYLKDSESAIFCEPNNGNDLVRKIEEVMTNKELRERLSINGRKIAEKFFGMETVAITIEREMI
jgi:glycosyltransferase involved in cell wall biosynthesis